MKITEISAFFNGEDVSKHINDFTPPIVQIKNEILTKKMSTNPFDPPKKRDFLFESGSTFISAKDLENFRATFCVDKELYMRLADFDPFFLSAMVTFKTESSPGSIYSAAIRGIAKVFTQENVIHSIKAECLSFYFFKDGVPVISADNHDLLKLYQDEK